MAAVLLLQTRQKRGIVYVIGNGGSAGIASHFVTDLMKTLEIPASTLFDSNLMTCIGNDYGYESVFSHPLNMILRPESLLVAISSSGKSRNILQAVSTARNKGARVMTLSGFSDDNPLRKKGDLNFYLPADEYGLVEMGHFFLLHTIVDHLAKKNLENSLLTQNRR
jgi:D-sedoheptulose 7-phosphate isomerase